MGPFKHQKNTLPTPCLAVNQRLDKQNALIILNPFMAAPSLASLARAILSIRRRAARRWGC